MEIGIIGAGKVGTTLGAYLGAKGIRVTGFYSRTYSHALEAAQYTKTEAYCEIRELLDRSDTLFLTVPDGEIGGVWDCISAFRLSRKIICHFSGSLSSNVFSGIEAVGAYGCSIHPMYSFNDKYNSWEDFSTACLTVEGQKEALQPVVALFEGLEHRIFTVRAADKAKYHAAATMASNAMIGLFSISLELLLACGFSEEEARTLLKPLVQKNVEAMLAQPLTEALTGPVERGDVKTVQSHLEALEGSSAQAVYRNISKELLKLAAQKNPSRQYEALQVLLEA